MKEIISKELLSEVLGEDVERVAKANNSELYYHIYNIKPTYATPRAVWSDTINIYELAHKNCIEWALSNGYNIHILIRNNGLIDVEVRYGIDFDYVKTFSAKKDTLKLQNTEEAIFKACEWIKENK